MKSILFATLAGAFALATAHAQEIGKAAPAFTAKNHKGESVSLADLKGKTVVLEWLNFECPFVKKQYSGGDMQKVQADAAAKGIVWLSVNSSADNPFFPRLRSGQRLFQRPSPQKQFLSSHLGS